DALAAGEVRERDAVAHPLEAQRKAMVHEPLAREPVADVQLIEQVDGALLEQARALTFLAIDAAARFEHHAIDAGAIGEARQKQAAGPRPDDPDLRAHAPTTPATAAAGCARRSGGRSRRWSRSGGPLSVAPAPAR